jgi:hypothetical protein
VDCLAVSSSKVTRDPEANTHLLPVLIAGFTLLLLLLVASGLVAFDSMRFVESDAARLAAEQESTIRLIDEMHREESNLSSIFYSLAANNGRDRELVLKRLDALQVQIRGTTADGIASRSSILWNQVGNAADAFIAEGRETVRANRRPTERFSEYRG